MTEKLMDEYILKGMDDFDGELSIEYNEKVIGKFSFQINYDLNDEIISVTPYLANIDHEHCHKGLGTSLIKRVSQDYIVYFKNIANEPVEDKNSIHYSDQGYQWAQKCIKLPGVQSDEETFESDFWMELEKGE